MKNLIYFNNNKEENLIKIRYEKQIKKLNENKKKESINSITSKFFDIYKLLSNMFNLNNEYELIITSNYQKIITIILLHICNNYTLLTKLKPHIILSYNESNIIINICKKLLKSNIIGEISILQDFDIIDEFKLKKQNNTLLAFVSNTNNLSYDLTKLSSFCKYYNIILISNIEDIIFNYYSNSVPFCNKQRHPFFNSQDLLALNYFNLKTKIHILLIKKNFIIKYKINQIDNLLTNNISNEIIIYLINIISYYNTFEQIYQKTLDIYNTCISLLSQEYRIIDYNTFQKTQDIYFTNSITIILLNNIKYTTPLLNNIIFSLYIPNMKFSNTNLLDYLKTNGVITNTNYKLPNRINKNITNGIININISYITKPNDIEKFTKIINNFYNLKTNSSKTNGSKTNSSNLKKKKFIQFSNPEYTILSKPFTLSAKDKIKNKESLKSILKK